MIKYEDLIAAIAECKGERNPNAQTCMKLASYYIILREEYGDKLPDNQSYSFNAAPEPVKEEYHSETEFGQLIQDKSTSSVYAVIDELLSVIRVIQPQLYNGVVRKLREI